MKFENLIKSGKYNEALEFIGNKFDNITKKEKKLLKRLLLFCAIDLVNWYNNRDITKNPNNPFYMQNDKLNFIKVILDSSEDIFYYLYLHINDEKYISKELEKYKDYFKEISFIPKNKFYTEHNTKNELQENGISIIDNIFTSNEIDKLKDITIDYLNKTDASAYYYNENRTRVYIREAQNPDLLSVFKHLTNSSKIEKILKEYINIEAKCDYIQLEYLKKAPIKTDDIKAWHIDNLSDQFKVFIPLVDVDETNAPLNYIPKTHLVKNLSNEMKSYWHYIYRMAGAMTKPTTGIPECMIKKIKFKQKKGIIKTGNIAIFNTTFIHTGSFVQEDTYRLNIVLVFHHLNTNRNVLFKQLKTFY